MILRSNTIWSHEYRLNCESNLRFSLSNSTHPPYAEITADDRYNFGASDFTVSITVKSGEGNYTLFSLGNTYAGTAFLVSLLTNQEISVGLQNRTPTLVQDHKNFTGAFRGIRTRHLTFVKTATEIKVYSNAEYRGSMPIVALVGVPLDFEINKKPVKIGSRKTILGISHFIVFNKALTKEEVSYAHKAGGLVPPSTHANCIAHYPFTQRVYPKLAEDHLPYTKDQLVVWDTVEQYNYAKTTTLKNNHAKLINFTDADVGPVIGTLVIDFHGTLPLDVYKAPVQALPEDNIEKDTNMPPPVKALKVTSVSFPSINGSGFGMLIQVHDTVTALTDLISGVPTISEYYINGNKVADEAAVLTAINLKQLIHVYLKGPLHVLVTVTFSGHIAAAYATNASTAYDINYTRELYDLTNNTLWQNPTVARQYKYSHYWLFDKLIDTNKIKNLTGTSNATTLDTIFDTLDSLRLPEIASEVSFLKISKVDTTKVEIADKVLIWEPPTESDAPMYINPTDEFGINATEELTIN